MVTYIIYIDGEKMAKGRTEIRNQYFEMMHLQSLIAQNDS